MRSGRRFHHANPRNSVTNPVKNSPTTPAARVCGSVTRRTGLVDMPSAYGALTEWTMPGDEVKTMQLPIVGVPRVAVIGAGSWGTTFAKILADGGSHVAMWARRPELAREIKQSRRNTDYLPGINLPRAISASSRLPKCSRAPSRSISPSRASRCARTSRRCARCPPTPRHSLMKGVERRTGLRMSQVIEQELACDPARIAVASGPNLALEIAREQPTAAVISSTARRRHEVVARRAATATSAPSSTRM